jgi:hypothetical protein
MVDKTLAQGKHTFKSRSRARLIGALLMVGVAVACLVVAVVSPPPGIAFRIIWAVIWLSFGLFGIRLARLATQVHNGRLVIRGFFRTRRFDASQISKISLIRLREGANKVYVWIPSGVSPQRRQRAALGTRRHRRTSGTARADRGRPGDLRAFGAA